MVVRAAARPFYAGNLLRFAGPGRAAAAALKEVIRIYTATLLQLFNGIFLFVTCFCDAGREPAVLDPLIRLKIIKSRVASRLSRRKQFKLRTTRPPSSSSSTSPGPSARGRIVTAPAAHVMISRRLFTDRHGSPKKYTQSTVQTYTGPRLFRCIVMIIIVVRRGDNTLHLKPCNAF